MHLFAYYFICLPFFYKRSLGGFRSIPQSPQPAAVAGEARSLQCSLAAIFTHAAAASGDAGTRDEDKPPGGEELPGEDKSPGKRDELGKG